MNITARSNMVLINKKPFKVLVCVVTLAAFLCNTILFDSAWAVGMPSAPTGRGVDNAGGSGLFKEMNVDTFTIPEYLGHIKDSYKGAGSEKIVIHIQDAHCNYAAQRKISEIIEYLNKEYGVDTINLEGGAKDYDLSIFTRIYDKPIREKTADYFVKEGLVNGAEYFAINNPEKATLWGIEDTKLYVDNLNVYRDSLKYKDEIDKHLKSINYILSNLKTKIYSPELLQLDMRYSQYKAGTLEFKDYLAYLIQAAKDKTIDIKEFTNIYLLGQTLSEEGNIDFKKANNQRDDLIDKLQKKLSKKSLEELVVKTVEFKSEKISQKEFYAYLTQKANLVGVELNGFPDLQRYIVYISMYGAIDKMKVMEEMDKLENAIKETLNQNDKQRELGKLSKNLAILRNIFNISLTKEDYKYYIDNEQSFNASNYVTFISKEAPLYKITAQLDKNITDLDRYRENVSKFYEYSFKRDDIFLKNIKFGRNKKIAVVVTGGFHTENMCEIFKKQDIAYISIMPAFSNYDGYACPYFGLLDGNKVGLQGKLYPIFTSTSSIQIASMLSAAIAPEVWGKANIDAFRAAVLVEEQVAMGRDIDNITRNGDNVIFHMKNGETEQMTIRALLDAVHQKDIDGQMEKLSDAADDFENIKNVDSILDGISTFLKSIEMPQVTLENILNNIKDLKGDNSDGRPLVRLVKGVTFRGHAGGQGIRINDDLKDNDKELSAVIMHEIIAGMFGDHFLAERVEQAFRANNIKGSVLSRSPPLPAAIWNMTAEQRLVVNRDFIQSPGEIAFGGRSREFKLLLVAWLYSADLQDILIKAVLTSSGPVETNEELVETICSAKGLGNVNELMAVVNNYAFTNPNVTQHLYKVVDMAKTPKYGGKDYSAQIESIESVIGGKDYSGEAAEIINQLSTLSQEARAPPSGAMGVDEDLTALGLKEILNPGTREFKLLLASLLKSAGSSKTYLDILKSSGPLENTALLEQILQKTGSPSMEDLTKMMSQQILSGNRSKLIENLNNVAGEASQLGKGAEYLLAAGNIASVLQAETGHTAPVSVRPTVAQPKAETAQVAKENIITRLSQLMPVDKNAKICFVCTANFNRSPAMEIMARHLANGIGNVEFSSFGLLVGGQLSSYKGTVNAELLAEAEKLGIDHNSSIVNSKPPTTSQIMDSDVIIVASVEHRDSLVAVARQQLRIDISKKVIVFGELLSGLSDTQRTSMAQELTVEGVDVNLESIADNMPDPIKGEISNRNLLILVGAVFRRTLIPVIVKNQAPIVEVIPATPPATGPQIAANKSGITRTELRRVLDSDVQIMIGRRLNEIRGNNNIPTGISSNITIDRAFPLNFDAVPVSLIVKFKIMPNGDAVAFLDQTDYVQLERALSKPGMGKITSLLVSCQSDEISDNELVLEIARLPAVMATPSGDRGVPVPTTPPAPSTPAVPNPASLTAKTTPLDERAMHNLLIERVRSTGVTVLLASSGQTVEQTVKLTATEVGIGVESGIVSHDGNSFRVDDKTVADRIRQAISLLESENPPQYIAIKHANGSRKEIASSELIKVILDGGMVQSSTGAKPEQVAAPGSTSKAGSTLAADGFVDRISDTDSIILPTLGETGAGIITGQELKKLIGAGKIVATAEGQFFAIRDGQDADAAIAEELIRKIADDQKKAVLYGSSTSADSRLRLINRNALVRSLPQDHPLKQALNGLGKILNQGLGSIAVFINSQPLTDEQKMLLDFIVKPDALLNNVSGSPLTNPPLGMGGMRRDGSPGDLGIVKNIALEAVKRIHQQDQVIEPKYFEALALAILHDAEFIDDRVLIALKNNPAFIEAMRTAVGAIDGQEVLRKVGVAPPPDAGAVGSVSPEAAQPTYLRPTASGVSATVEVIASEIASHLNESPLALINSTRTVLMTRLNTIPKEEQVNFVRSLLAAIDSALTSADRTKAHLAIRAVFGAEALSEIGPGAFDVVTQIVPIEIKSKIPGEIKEAKRRLKEKDYGANAKSMEVACEDSADLESQLDGIVGLMLNAMKDKPNAMGLIYIPLYLRTDTVRSKLQSIIDLYPNIKVQITEEAEGEHPDIMTLFELGVKLLDWDRNKAKGLAPSQSLLNLLAAVAASNQNPIDILNNLFNFDHTLRIREIDLKTIQQTAEAMQLVRQAL